MTGYHVTIGTVYPEVQYSALIVKDHTITSRTELAKYRRTLLKEFYITPEQAARLSLLAAYWNTSRSAVIRRMLDKFLDEELKAIQEDAQPPSP